MGTQVTPLNPNLETSPRDTDFRIDSSAIIGVVGESHFQCEHARVAGESFPQNSHVTASFPVPSYVPSSKKSLSHPVPAHALGNVTPADRITMPFVGAMLLCAVRPTLVYGITLVVFRHAILQQVLRHLLIEVIRTKRSPPSRLPRIPMFRITLVVHNDHCRPTLSSERSSPILAVVWGHVKWRFVVGGPVDSCTWAEERVFGRDSAGGRRQAGLQKWAEPGKIAGGRRKR